MIRRGSRQRGPSGPDAGPQRALITAGFVSRVGNGLFDTAAILSFTFVVHLPAAQVGLGLTIAGLSGLAAGVPAGNPADRPEVVRAGRPEVVRAGRPAVRVLRRALQRHGPAVPDGLPPAADPAHRPRRRTALDRGSGVRGQQRRLRTAPEPARLQGGDPATGRPGVPPRPAPLPRQLSLDGADGRCPRVGRVGPRRPRRVLRARGCGGTSGGRVGRADAPRESRCGSVRGTSAGWVRGAGGRALGSN